MPEKPFYEDDFPPDPSSTPRSSGQVPPIEERRRTTPMPFEISIGNLHEVHDEKQFKTMVSKTIHQIVGSMNGMARQTHETAIQVVNITAAIRDMSGMPAAIHEFSERIHTLASEVHCLTLRTRAAEQDIDEVKSSGQDVRKLLSDAAELKATELERRINDVTDPMTPDRARRIALEAARAVAMSDKLAKYERSSEDRRKFIVTVATGVAVSLIVAIAGAALAWIKAVDVTRSQVRTEQQQQQFYWPYTYPPNIGQPAAPAATEQSAPANSAAPRH